MQKDEVEKVKRMSLYIISNSMRLSVNSQWWCHSFWSPIHHRRDVRNPAKPLLVSVCYETPQESFHGLSGGSPWSNLESDPGEKRTKSDGVLKTGYSNNKSKAYKCKVMFGHTVLECRGSRQWKCSAVRVIASLRAATNSVCLMFLDFRASASSSPNSRELRVDFLRRDCLLTT